MAFSLTQLFSFGFGYLVLLFLIAYITERGYIPAKIVRHPIIYVLSIGVYASAWAIYGSVGFAYQYGYNFLTYYLGLSGAFLLAPIFLAPILRLSQTYQLGSLADLLAYRYRSQWAGSIVTIIMMLGVMPLLALQIQAVADSVHILNQQKTQATFAFVFVIFITMFAVLFGARHFTAREKHEGLVVAIAFESLVKIAAIGIIAWFSVYEVFGSYEGLESWLVDRPQALDLLYAPLDQGPWRSLILAFFAAAVVMPHVFHMAFTENLNPRALMTASWGVPLYLFLCALAVPLILWAALKVEAPTDPEYFTLGLAIATNSPKLAIVIFIAGISAASGIMIVTTLALAAMVQNHLVLPLYQPSAEQNIYTWLLWTRRILIATILAISYLFYQALDGAHDLSELGLLAFVATLQFTPGLMGVMFWPGANRNGFIAGLLVGFFIWLFGMLLPVLASVEALGLSIFDLGFSPTVDNWQGPSMLATLLNSIIFVIVSVLTKQSPAEKAAAATCTVDNLRRPYRWEISASSIKEFVTQLAQPLGLQTAKREVELALKDLAMSPVEMRPFELRRLRDRLETNLSGLLGPSVAQEIIDQYLPYKTHSEQAGTEDIHFIENRLEEYRDKLTGLAAELDHLRRFHRQTLQDLPMGVCSLGHDNEILGWNKAIENLTGIAANEVMGSNIDSIDKPWRQLILDFVDGNTLLHLQKEIEIKGASRWISLHKAAVDLKAESNTDHPNADQSSTNSSGSSATEPPTNRGRLVVVIEDVTEIQLLEAKLTHSERLASIGRLAAGVAHEIGNPITGIDCLAQELRAETNDNDVSVMAEQILGQTKRVTRIVQSLMSFSRSGTHNQQEYEAVNVALCVQESMDLVLLAPNANELIFENHCSSQLYTFGDPQRLMQIFINLLTNARDASSLGDTISVTDSHTEQTVDIHFTDHGCGIPKDVQEKIFEPFVTTKDPGKGTGLGLALVYSIVKDHYGQISITSPLHHPTEPDHETLASDSLTASTEDAATQDPATETSVTKEHNLQTIDNSSYVTKINTNKGTKVTITLPRCYPGNESSSP
ncbi:MAG: PAS domain-containing protein [Pseudomonadales bacterium]|nr:PAS domain-containing protein [Pseudomonadales bacterium]